MQKTFQVALFFIFFINSTSNCYEANQKRDLGGRRFCYDGYGVHKEDWKMVNCRSGTCVKIKTPSNEHRYCDITGNHATECIYDNPKVMSLSTQTLKQFKQRLMFIYSRK